MKIHMWNGRPRFYSASA